MSVMQTLSSVKSVAGKLAARDADGNRVASAAGVKTMVRSGAKLLLLKAAPYLAAAAGILLLVVVVISAVASAASTVTDALEKVKEAIVGDMAELSDAELDELAELGDNDDGDVSAQVRACVDSMNAANARISPSLDQLGDDADPNLAVAWAAYVASFAANDAGSGGSEEGGGSGTGADPGADPSADGGAHAGTGPDQGGPGTAAESRPAQYPAGPGDPAQRPPAGQDPNGPGSQPAAPEQPAAPTTSDGLPDYRDDLDGFIALWRAEAGDSASSKQLVARLRPSVPPESLRLLFALADYGLDRRGQGSGDAEYVATIYETCLREN